MEQRSSLYSDFIDRETSTLHHSYADELRLCEAVQNAHPSALEISRRLFTAEHSGLLSEDPLTNLKYLFVASVTLITRFCIEGGLPPPFAYRISDLHIRALDHCQSQEELLDLHQGMLREFLERMRFVKGSKGTSRHVEAASGYILEHLSADLSLAAVSREIRVSSSHLAHLFIKELNIPFARYVRRQRVEAAKDLLRYTDHPASLIASLVGFSSQSHMIHVFKETVGETPAAYRKKLPHIYGSGGHTPEE